MRFVREDGATILTGTDSRIITARLPGAPTDAITAFILEDSAFNPVVQLFGDGELRFTTSGIESSISSTEDGLKFVFGAASPVDIESLYLNLEGPVSTALLPTQNSTMLRFKAHWWDEGSPADTFYDAGIQYQITEVDPVVSKLSFQIDGGEAASLDQSGVLSAAVFVSNVGTPTYGVAVAINAAAGCVHNITATDGVAFTISNPTNALTGQVIFIKVKNSSGGALGTVTWDTLYKMSAWTSPADGFSRAVEFYFDGTNWVQLTASGVDIPN
jgi:hypothetical protein